MNKLITVQSPFIVLDPCKSLFPSNDYVFHVDLAEDTFLSISNPTTNKFWLHLSSPILDIKRAVSPSQLPYIIISSNHVLIPQLLIVYTPSLIFSSIHITLLSHRGDEQFSTSQVSLSNVSDQSVYRFKNLLIDFDFQKFFSSSDGFLVSCSSLVASNDNIVPLPNSSPSQSGSVSSDLINSDLATLTKLEDVDDSEDEFTQSSSLLDFLTDYPIYYLQPVKIAMSTLEYPRRSLLLLPIYSFLPYLKYLVTVYIRGITHFLPFIGSISMYLHSRNRFPLFSFLLPLFTSILSIIFLCTSTSTPLLLYGALSFLIMSRILKVGYISSKIERRVGCDLYPFLFSLFILPMYLLILALNVVGVYELIFLSFLLFIFSEFFRFSIKNSHFIGDVRLTFKLLPSLLFAFLSFVNLTSSVQSLVLSYSIVIILIILFPRTFKIAV